MKKTIALCLCLALALSLAACGSAQPEVTIVPTEAPAATAVPTAEPTGEPTAQLEGTELLNNFLEEFAQAYFYGTAEDLRPYLAGDFQDPVEAYQGGEPSGIEVRPLSPREDDPDHYATSIQFIAGEEDSYTYLSLDLVRTEEGWKVAFYGLEK